MPQPLKAPKIGPSRGDAVKPVDYQLVQAAANRGQPSQGVAASPPSLGNVMAQQGKPVGPMARLVQGLRYLITGAQPGAWMTPNEPIMPIAQDATVGRQYDYPVGWNLTGPPQRRDSGTSFWELRQLADNEALTRLAIETRKDQAKKLKFKIVSRDEGKDVSDDPRVKDISAKLAFPDQRRSWQSWLSMVVEELLVTDAVTIYPRMTNGGDLWGLELIDGATIKPLIDGDGRRPVPPEPAYQQWLKGVAANNLTSDQVVYAPRNERVWRVYGFSPVEQVLMIVNTALRRQMLQLQTFTEGNVPELIITCPEDWTAENIQSYQEYWDAMLMGRQEAKRRLRFMPGAGQMKPIPLKEPPLKDEFDEWLARVICFAFSLPPTAFVKQTNRATAETAQETAEDEGLLPLMVWLKDLIDLIILKYWKAPDLQLAWDDDRPINPTEQAKLDDVNLKNGSTTLDEVRQARGLDPYPDKIGSRPLIYTAQGVVPLDTSIDNADNPKPPMAPVGPDGQPIKPQGPPGAGGAPGKGNSAAPAKDQPNGKPGDGDQRGAKKLMKAAAATRVRLYPRRVSALKNAIHDALRKTAAASAAPLAKSLGLAKTDEPLSYAGGAPTTAELRKAAGGDKPAIRVKAPELVDDVDVPYLAGISKNGSKVYFDRRLPKKLKTKSGWVFNPRDFVVVHEVVEWLLIQDGLTYDDGKPDCAHIRATEAEHAAVVARGGDPAEYEEALQEVIEECYAAAKAGEMTDIPSDLARYPYSASGELKLLDNAAKMAKATNDERVDRALQDLDLGGMAAIDSDLEDALVAAAGDGALTGLAQVGVDDKSATELANEHAQTWAKDRAAQLITSDSDGGTLRRATRDLIRGTVSDAVEEGWSSGTLGRALEECYAFSADRAETIARTELAMADSQGALAGYRASGVVTGKGWQRSNEGYDCDICQDNEDAGVIGLDEEFPSGDDTAPAHPRCECVVLPYLDEDEDADKVYKPGNVGYIYKYSPDQARDERGRFGEGGASTVKITKTTERAFDGKQTATKTKLSKLESGALGEEVAKAVLAGMGKENVGSLNVGRNNAPIDVRYDGGVAEVKTGLVSNGSDAQKWRATIGQPGKEESAWLKTASADDKKAWNAQKQQAIIDRKNACADEIEKSAGVTIERRTIGIIIDSDRSVADVYAFDGFHSSIRWSSEQAKKAYVGSYSYA